MISKIQSEQSVNQQNYSSNLSYRKPTLLMSSNIPGSVSQNFFPEAFKMCYKEKQPSLNFSSSVSFSYVNAFIGIIDQNIQLTILFSSNLLKQGFDFIGIFMINTNWNASTSSITNLKAEMLFFLIEFFILTASAVSSRLPPFPSDDFKVRP